VYAHEQQPLGRDGPASRRIVIRLGGGLSPGGVLDGEQPLKPVADVLAGDL